MASPVKKKSGALSLLGKAALSAATVIAAKKLFSASVHGGKLDLSRKIVLITGGSRGLGLALAQELGNKGCRLALCARQVDELQEACSRLTAMNIEAVPFVCDVTDQAQVSRLIESVVEHFGRIDVLVNNAGLIKVGPFDTFHPDDFENAMDLMFWAPVHLTWAVLPHMKKQGGGHIVNITSVGGRVSVPHLLPYSCAKFALVAFSTGLSTEIASHGVHVLTVVPGLMRTGSYLNAEFLGAATDEFTWFGLLGNLPGFSVAADYAASCIRGALENRRHNCTISFPAKLLIAGDALMPEITRTVFLALNRFLLPAPQPSEKSLPGKVLNPSFGKLFQILTALGKMAAVRYNERTEAGVSAR